MAGRHRKRREAQVPQQWDPHSLGIIDAQTHLEHVVTEQSLAAHRHSGRYPASAEPRSSRRV